MTRQFPASRQPFPQKTTFFTLFFLLFSAFSAFSATFTVTNTDDNGLGSLLQAMLDANDLPGAHVIEFSVAGTMTLETSLPQIIDALTIDGATAPGFAPGAPTFHIDGPFLVFSAFDPGMLVIKDLDLSLSGWYQGAAFDLTA